ncbi:uncharacterized protein UTRI_06215_B [Ustilago trichophora]|uniref:Uncharacterized protein n=1 Tax=Ustilago trichophora TaxID=86804 RepID=A0A5C3EJM8_9BASI|nr:uncharacterized protein UTRI_06215_B [Ustilago trichophora]
MLSLPFYSALFFAALRTPWALPYTGSDGSGGEAEREITSAFPSDLNAQVGPTSPHTIRLFGKTLSTRPPQLQAPTEHILFPLQPERAQAPATILNTGPATGQGLASSSKQLPNHRRMWMLVGFRRDRLPELAREHARFFNLNVFKGSTKAIPAERFNTATMAVLTAWSSELLADHTALVYAFRRRDTGEKHEHVYLARPMRTEEFRGFFPEIKEDFSRLVPFIMYRVQIDQQRLEQRAMIDIVGVELIQPTSADIKAIEPVQKLTFGSVMHLIVSGQWH